MNNYIRELLGSFATGLLIGLTIGITAWAQYDPGSLRFVLNMIGL